MQTPARLISGATGEALGAGEVGRQVRWQGAKHLYPIPPLRTWPWFLWRRFYFSSFFLFGFPPKSMGVSGPLFVCLSLSLSICPSLSIYIDTCMHPHTHTHTHTHSQLSIFQHWNSYLNCVPQSHCSGSCRQLNNFSCILAFHIHSYFDIFEIPLHLIATVPG
jgi:hypothetical protein